jgi:hypothetical protein
MAYIGNAPGFSTQRVVTTFTATGGQTSFSPNGGYIVGYVDVYYNGVRLVAGDDFSATNGSTVTLTVAASAGDVVEIVSYVPRGLTDGYTKAEADARYEPIDSAYTKAEADARYPLASGLATVATSGSYNDLLNKPEGGGTPVLVVVSATTQAALAGRHYVLTNAASTTVTLPASPAAGDVVWVTVANGRVDNVIARNGSNINSLAENMTINSAYAGVQLRYADATRGWIFT